MSKRLLGIGDVYTYDYKQVHKTRNVGFGYYDPNKVSTTSSTDGYVLVDGVLSVVNEDGSSEPGPGPGPEPSLPPYTLRLKYAEGFTPSISYGTLTQVSSSPNIWDWTYANTNWNGLLNNQDYLLEVIDGNTTGVTNMINLFYGCYSLTSVCMLDTTVCTTMNQMFRGCNSLTTVPMFNTSRVTNMGNMFADCTSLTTVPLLNTSNVTDMNRMFQGCSNLTTVPLFVTSSVTNMSEMFAYCESLTSVPLFNTSSVTNMEEMFFMCTSLTVSPLFDTSSVTNMHNMFANCESLNYVQLFNTSNVTNMKGMFADCTNVQSGSLALYTQASTQTNPPSTYSNAFKNCGADTETGAAELAQIPASWGGTGA